MTDHPTVLIAGREVGGLLRERLDRVVDAVLAELVAELPVYGRLPRELVDGDVRRVVRRALRMCADAMPAGVPEEADLAELRDSAERRAEEGVPMDVVMAAYHRGARVALDDLLSLASADDFPAVGPLLRSMMAFMEHATAAVASGYGRFSDTVLAEQATARQLLLQALLSGAEDLESVAQQAAVRLPPSYTVLRLAAGPHPDETDPSVDRAVAGRRKLRRIREELQRHHAEPVLWLPTEDGGLALVPAAGPPDLGRLREVVRAVRQLAGAELHAGLASGSPAEVPQAAELAREVLETAVGGGRPGGLYTLDDVALDYQLTRPGPALAVLASRLAVLDDQPELAQTLATFLATGLNRRQTARDLHVHPNTIDNRIRRVAALTGLDPARPADLPAIAAALAARTRLRS